MDRLNFLLTEFRNCCGGYPLVATDNFSGGGTGPKQLIAGRTGETIYIIRITFTVTTDAAHNLTFEDSAGTPVPVLQTTNSPGAGKQFQVDFGPDGFPLTEGKDFQVAADAAGLAGAISWIAYQRRTATATPNIAGKAGVSL